MVSQCNKYKMFINDKIFSVQRYTEQTSKPVRRSLPVESIPRRKLGIAN